MRESFRNLGIKLVCRVNEDGASRLAIEGYSEEAVEAAASQYGISTQFYIQICQEYFQNTLKEAVQQKVDDGSLTFYNSTTLTIPDNLSEIIRAGIDQRYRLASLFESALDYVV